MGSHLGVSIYYAVLLAEAGPPNVDKGTSTESQLLYFSGTEHRSSGDDRENTNENNQIVPRDSARELHACAHSHFGGRLCERLFPQDKNGTYVQPHYRSNPDGNPYNNWSFPGNVNPHTGKVATGNPETYIRNYYGLRSGNPPNAYGAPRSDMSPMEAVQTGLAALGYSPGSVDGVPGPRTFEVVKRFQSNKGLSASGELNERTIKPIPTASILCYKRKSKEPNHALSMRSSS